MNHAYRWALMACISLALVSQSSSRLGIRPLATIPTSTYECIYKSNHTFTVIQVESSPSGITDVQNLVNAAYGGFRSSIWYSPCKARYAYEEAYTLSTKVSRAFYNATVWVKPTSVHSYLPCAWNNSNFLDNCQYLRDFVQTLRNAYIQVGIATNQQEWAYFFGGKCDEFANSPLLQTKAQGSESFNDFVKFGGWDLPTLREFKQTKFICGAQLNIQYQPDA